MLRSSSVLYSFMLLRRMKLTCSVLIEVRQYVEGVVWGNEVFQQADPYRKRLQDCLARFGVSFLREEVCKQ